MSKLIRQLIDVSPLRVRPARDREELLTLLRAKLIEEAVEVGQASAGYNGATYGGVDDEHLKLELADLLEACMSLAHEHGFTQPDIEFARARKFTKLGGFLPGRVYT